MIFIGIVNVLAFCCLDYSFRVWHDWPTINRVSVSLEIICNIAYGVDMVINIIAQGVVLERNTYFR
jgi:hypothetical protein